MEATDNAAASRGNPGARLMLRADLRDAQGEPRVCLARRGQPLQAFASIAAALAALRALEEARDDR